jgi:hypothetical protein
VDASRRLPEGYSQPRQQAKISEPSIPLLAKMREGFFVANPLARVNLNQRSNLNFNDDGSLGLYIPNEFPGTDREDNWLPAPSGDFGLFMRLCRRSDNSTTRGSSAVRYCQPF